MTKLSNVYFGFAPGCASVATARLGAAAPGAARGVVLLYDLEDDPYVAPEAVAHRTTQEARKWLSIHPRVKSFGRTTAKSSSRSAPGLAARTTSRRSYRSGAPGAGGRRRSRVGRRGGRGSAPPCSNVLLSGAEKGATRSALHGGWGNKTR